MPLRPERITLPDGTVLYTSDDAAAQTGLNRKQIYRLADLHGIGQSHGRHLPRYFTAADIARLAALPIRYARARTIRRAWKSAPPLSPPTE